MIRIPYNQLLLLNFQQTIQKLANSTFKTPKAFQVKAVTKGLRDGFFAAREEYKNEIESKYALLVEGKVQEPVEGTKSKELELPFTAKLGTEGDAKGALEAYHKKELKLDQRKISAELLFEVNEWSPRELEALEFIVSEPGDPA